MRPHAWARGGALAVLATVPWMGSSCRRDTRPTDPPLLAVGEETVRRSDFDRYLAGVEARTGKPVTAEVAGALLAPFLEERVLVLTARQRGLVSRGAAAAEEQAAVQGLLADEVLSKVQVSEQELAAYCATRASEYDVPERIVLRQILVATDNEARDIQRRLLKEPRSFEALARTRSRAPEAATGGLMGVFARGELPRELEAASFALAAGESSGPVATTLGHHVLRVDERRPARAGGVEDCVPAARGRLQREKSDRGVRDFVRGLLARARVGHDAGKQASSF